MSPAGAEPLRLLAGADAVLIAARLLDRPERAQVEAASLRDGDLRRLARAAGGDTDWIEALIDAVDEVRTLEQAGLAAEYARLFDGAVACPINETAYVRRDKGAILADLCGFYRAFGFEPAAGTGEKADHLVTELEFLGLLQVMLARACETGHREQRRVAQSALVAYCTDHLAEWIGAFCERLEATTSLRFYRRTAAALRGISGATFRDLGVVPSEPPCLAADVAPGTPYECGLIDIDR